ncbi:hypothetical protein PR048_004988 [Dryococelus australis]|uniref:PiggyBac transposable element-derived protein domain-containing protein n=1 Tax=Dryococelus australis TaxID=614101 RepID=A0ABQ9I6Y5_9NEOP|nr:hypothetical protein PR048_004988 [Dryococelus australis]
MPVNKFEKIQPFLHLNDNATLIAHDQPGHDQLHKIRPVIDIVEDKIPSIPVEERLAVDEQICSIKALHHLRHTSRQDTELQKRSNTIQRLSTYEYGVCLEEHDVSSVLWVDTKYVRMLPTYAEYNKHMSGVDLLRQSDWQMQDSRKKHQVVAYFRLFYHLLDLCIINLRRQFNKMSTRPTFSQGMKFVDFRIGLGEMCKIDPNPLSKRGATKLGITASRSREIEEITCSFSTIPRHQKIPSGTLASLY